LGSLEISVYCPQEAKLVRAGEQVSRPLAAPLFAALLTIGLHVLLVAPLFWGSGAKQPRPPAAKLLGDVGIGNRGGPELQWVELVDASTGNPTGADPLAALPPPTLASIAVTNLLTNAAADSTNPVATDSETAAASELVGRYTGQISARIERAWVKPRTTIGADLFACRIRILQDSAGNVLEATLERCNGTARWRASLVSAIKTASPLPAPPDPRVFARVVHLDFKSLAYAPGAASEQYEPALLAARADESAQSISQRTPKELGDAMRGSKFKDGSIDLRIQGNQPPLSGESRDLREGPRPENPADN
jgi:hypothetical protein